MFTTLVVFLLNVSFAIVQVESGIQGPHLEFPGVNSTSYQLTRDGNKVTLDVPLVDKESLKVLGSLKSDLVKSLNIYNTDRTQLVFQLANSRVDVFDYLTDKPDRLIIDIYNNIPEPAKLAKVEPKPEAVTVAEAGTTAQTGGDEKSDEKEVSKKMPRSPAQSDALVLAKDDSGEIKNSSRLLDGADPTYERLKIKDYEISQDAIIKSKGMLLLELPLLPAGSRFYEHMKVTQPVYEIVPTQTEENKQARLLLVLFQNNRNSLFLKTLTWFRNKYPESQYNEMFDFMSADIHMRIYETTSSLSEFELAIHEYLAAVEKHPNSPLAARTQIKVAFETFERGDYLGAIRLFQRRLEDKKTSPLHRDAALLGLSQALMKLNKSDEALGRLETLIKFPSSDMMKADAMLQKAELFDSQGNTKMAIEAFEQAIKANPNEVKRFPRTFYNFGLVQFKAGQYKDSIESLRNFVIQNSDHPNSPYALTRVGEIFEILGAPQERVQGIYREAEYRYSGTVGALLPRMKILSHRMATMKPREAEAAIAEMRSSAIKLPFSSVDFYVTSLIADGLHGRGEYGKSANELISFYQSHPTELRLPQLADKIQRIINDQIYDQSQKGDFLGVFSTYEQNQDTWLKNSNRIDTQFFLAKASETAFDLNSAKNGYQNVLNRTYSIQGTQEAKERSVLERLPSADSLHLRLSQTLMKMGKTSEAYGQIMKLKNPHALSPDEQIERMHIATSLLKSRGDFNTALKYTGELMSEWQAEPEKLASVLLESARIYTELKNEEKALAIYSEIEKLNKSNLLKDQDLVYTSKKEKIDLILSSKKFDFPALNGMNEFLGQYEEKYPLASYRYRLGEYYIKSGEIQKAKEIWSKLKGEGSQVWAEIADESLKHAEWLDQNRKYFKRLPASSGGQL